MTAQVAKGPAPKLFRQLVGRAPQASFSDVATLRILHKFFGQADNAQLGRALCARSDESGETGDSAGAGGAVGAGGVNADPATYNKPQHGNRLTWLQGLGR